MSDHIQLRYLVRQDVAYLHDLTKELKLRAHEDDYELMAASAMAIEYLLEILGAVNRR